MRVLVVDDDPAFRRLADLALEEAGAEHGDAADAATARAALAKPPPFDAILLDIELPGERGVELLAELRRRGVSTPIVLVTVRDGVDDRVAGLDIGADDYLVKPFDFRELIARLRAAVRTRELAARTRVGPVEIDRAHRQVTIEGRRIALSPREFDLLCALADAGGEAVSRADLLRRVWGLEIDPHTNVVDVHASRLRRKLHDREGRLVQNVRGVGYRLGE
jgi:DNA-binding response OmpR family regulator